MCEKNVAILMATYNGEMYLEEQIDSLLNQDYKGKFTIYINDNGSSDRTVDIIEKYKKVHPQKIVITNINTANGAKENFIGMMKNIVSDYYMFCDQDDVWKPSKIRRSLELMESVENGTTPSLVFSDLEVVDARLNTINDSYLKMTNRNPMKNNLMSLLQRNVVAGCTMLFNLPLRNIAVKLSSTYNISMHDLWVSVCAATFGQIAYLDDTTIYYRQHCDNAVGARRSVSKIAKEKIKNIISGRQIERSKEGIKQIEHTCYELLNISSNYNVVLSEGNHRFLEDVCSDSKIRRVSTFLKYGMGINGILRFWKIVFV